MKNSFYETLLKADNLDTEDEKIAFLAKTHRENYPVFFNFLYYTINPEVVKKWCVTKDLKYKTNNSKGIENYLSTQIRQFYIFIEGGYPNLSQTKRDNLFIQLLESLDKNEAEMLYNFVNRKKLPFKAISQNIWMKAIPQTSEWFKKDGEDVVSEKNNKSEIIDENFIDEEKPIEVPTTKKKK